MAAQYGAHEMMEIHEVLTDTIDGINQFQLYRPHVKDPQLLSMLDNQIRHMTQEYNNMVTLLNQAGRGQAIPYRAPFKTAAPVYGLNHPETQTPNTSMTDMNDRDVASGMLGCHKSSACMRMVASLECADPQIRRTIQQGAVNCGEQAYEVWQYMNHRGYYQVPTMNEMTTNTVMRTYASANTAQMDMMQPAPVNQPISQYRMMQ
ncbi:spore coat protein [Ammoniphilus sp. 3BR4]|uniref:spore coat protein n=1 Tax=Ammoniphilus sp. 3BR4 TaxID=3158265 RepID=UPI003467940E